ncbi:MAG TPA: sialate O-acetylesterase [Candidatus Kapabacteria bacterium]
MSGSCSSTFGYDSLYLDLKRNGVSINRTQIKLTDGTTPFSIVSSIRADTVEYSITVGITSGTKNFIFASRDSIVAGDVYLIAGQSNAVLARGDVRWEDEYCRTFGNYNSTYPSDTNWAIALADTNTRRQVVGVWALYLMKALRDSLGVPICIINGAVGGKSIEQSLPTASNPTNLATVYGMMLYRVQKAGLASSAKALFWYQGEANNNNGYLENFTTLYKSWKTHYPSLKKVYVFQIRPGCNTNRVHAELRETQRTLSEKYSDITVLPSVAIKGHDGCHLTTDGYIEISKQVYPVVMNDFYNGNFENVAAPNITKAIYVNQLNNRIALIFAPSAKLLFTPDTVVGGFNSTIKESFYLNGDNMNVSSVEIGNDTVFLNIKFPTGYDRVTYVPDKYYPGKSIYYEGPWITNDRGIGAFTFYEFPVEGKNGFANLSSPKGVQMYPNPARSYIQISDSESDSLDIRIYNIYGGVVYSDIRYGGNTTIGIGSLPSGSYSVSINGKRNKMIKVD